MRPRALLLRILAVTLLLARPAAAQMIESAGSRAMGMGGAFVAVGTDSSATWWNPAALAAGAWIDMNLARAATDVGPEAAGHRETVSSFSLSAPMLGFSYYRLRLSDIGDSGSTAAGPGDRQDTGASLLGVTLVQSIVSGLHVGTTLKYVHGQGLASEDPDPGRFDYDVGALVVHRAWRVGLVARNLRQPAFQSARVADTPGDPLILGRQVRAGIAYDAEAAPGKPLTVSVDVDLKRYATLGGDRQVIAAGAERWLFARHLALRAGGRVNAVGEQTKAATAGGTVMVRSGMYLDAHAVFGGADEERGWGAAARFSF